MPDSLSVSPAERLARFASKQFPGTFVRIESMPGDVSTRAYFRIEAAGERMIAAVYAEAFDETNFPFLDVTRLFSDCGVAVPRVLAADGAAGVILQEDLGDVRLQDALADMSDAEKFAAYRQANDLIIQFQKTTEPARRADSVAWRLVFDEEKFFWEMQYFYKNYFVNHRRAPLSPEREALLLGELFALCRRLASVKRVVCHRDYHSRNLMRQGDRLRVIDHQDARLGPATYDAVSLIGDPYADLPVALQDDLKRDFREKFFEAFADAHYANRDEFEAEYALMMIQRMLKAVGTYAHQAAVRNNPSYLGYVPVAFNAAARALAQVADMPVAAAVIEEIVAQETA
jgi:aminoglycoside/choline kinase family phosphotransferase